MSFLRMMKRRSSRKQAKVQKTLSMRYPVKIEQLEPRLLLAGDEVIDYGAFLPMEAQQVDTFTTYEYSAPEATSFDTNIDIDYSSSSARMVDLRELNNLTAKARVNFEITTNMGQPDANYIYTLKNGLDDWDLVVLDNQFKTSGKFVFAAKPPYRTVSITDRHFLFSTQE